MLTFFSQDTNTTCTFVSQSFKRYYPNAISMNYSTILFTCDVIPWNRFAHNWHCVKVSHRWISSGEALMLIVLLAGNGSPKQWSSRWFETTLQSYNVTRMIFIWCTPSRLINNMYLPWHAVLLKLPRNKLSKNISHNYNVFATAFNWTKIIIKKLDQNYLRYLSNDE